MTCKEHDCEMMLIWADGWRLLWCPRCHPLYSPEFRKDDDYEK